MMLSTTEKVRFILETNYGFKQRRSGEWRGNCPWKPGSDSKSMSVRFHDGEHGTWAYHAGNESGSLYELAERLDIELPENGRVHVNSTKVAYSELADYAQAHYAPLEAFEKARWQKTRYNNRPALMFPVQTGQRIRFLDEEGGYIWSQDGGSNCWYGLQRAVDMAYPDALPLVLCNGEASTVVAQWRDIPAFCGTGGEGAASETMIAELNDRWSGQIIIALDCDSAGHSAANNLQEALGRGVIVDLGLTDKGDLADFCALHEDSTMAALKRLAGLVKSEQQQQTAEFIEFVSIDTMLSRLSAFVHDDPTLFGRTIQMPFASLREHGGFAEIMTTKKIWLIGNVSGGGKTIWSEVICDEFNASNHNVFYIGDEWSPMELTARSVQRAYVGEHVVTYEDYLRYADGRMDLTDNQRIDISRTIRVIRTRPGRTFYMRISEGAMQSHENAVPFLEDILQAVLYKIRDLRAADVQVDVLILDYLSLYLIRAVASNLEEYKVGLFKLYCKTLDVLGISTSQVNKAAEDHSKMRGRYLSAHDLHYVRPDKANLITTMNRLYLNNYSARLDEDMPPDEAVALYLDENDQPIPTPNLAIQTVKNSVNKPGLYAYFHFDFKRLRICEGLHPDYFYHDGYQAVMSHRAFEKPSNMVSLADL